MRMKKKSYISWTTILPQTLPEGSDGFEVVETIGWAGSSGNGTAPARCHRLGIAPLVWELLAVRCGWWSLAWVFSYIAFSFAIPLNAPCISMRGRFLCCLYSCLLSTMGDGAFERDVDVDHVEEESVVYLCSEVCEFSPFFRRTQKILFTPRPRLPSPLSSPPSHPHPFPYP